MAKPKYVTITSVVEGEILVGKCTEEAVPAWRAGGWTVVDDGSSETALTSTVSDQSDEDQLELDLADFENEGEDQ